MAWSTSPTWEHGDDNVSEARMTIISDNLQYLYDAISSIQNPALMPMGEGTTGNDGGFIHQWRWLHYETRTGEQGTISASGQTNVQLTSSDGEMSVYDLANVSWLVQGSAYQVTGCKYACERREA